MLANPNYYPVMPKRSNHGVPIILSTVLLLTLIVGLTCAWLVLRTVEGYYATRIYPNVYVLGIALGGLAPDEAAAAIGEAADQPNAGLLVLRDGSRQWSASWSEAGLRLDVPATVQSAFAVGHADTSQSWQGRVSLWLSRHDVPPVLWVEPESARRLLKRLEPIVFVPATDASLHLSGGQIIVTPAQPGRALDIEATLASMIASIPSQGGAPQVDLVFRAVPPRVADVSVAKEQIEESLNRRIDLWAYDVLTQETFTWTLERNRIITWLRIEHAEPAGEQLLVRCDPGAVQATLTDLAAGLQGRGFRWEEATQQVLDAFHNGGGTVRLYLTHPSSSHVVQPGDTLGSIAAKFGMTSWLITQANPGADLDWLQVGQELIIPSVDVLLPYIPVSDKRIVISIPKQRMWVYQDGQLLYDWPISTGIADSPTHTGVFQILSKEENAYASLWDLWMPHFMAIYPSGPGFYNGIHALPILSSGRRLWEGLLGSPASYGCIILGIEQAETLYQWAEIGVPVVIEG